jgi:hypothetical protein
MNLPEYRRAIRQAQRVFLDIVMEASEALAKELAHVDSLFMEDDEPSEDVPDAGIGIEKNAPRRRT